MVHSIKIGKKYYYFKIRGNEYHRIPHVHISKNRKVWSKDLTVVIILLPYPKIDKGKDLDFADIVLNYLKENSNFVERLIKEYKILNPNLFKNE